METNLKDPLVGNNHCDIERPPLEDGEKGPEHAPPRPRLLHRSKHPPQSPPTPPPPPTDLTTSKAKDMYAQQKKKKNSRDRKIFFLKKRDWERNGMGMGEW